MPYLNIVRIDLPYPPTVNHYWRKSPRGMYITRKGRSYRDEVRIRCIALPGPLEGRLSVMIEAYPPDRRRRDIDNLAKATLDALQKAGVYHDDNQIDHLTIRRQVCAPGGRLSVSIREIE